MTSGTMTVVERPSDQLAEQQPSPLPVFRGPQMAEALVAYKELQAALDLSMPDAIMTLDGKPYRKKSYWRAVAVAFNLSVDVVSERREVYGTLQDGTENYAWMVTCRASSPKGRSETGDGACAAAEKQKGRMMPSEHNVRSHAHTRAFNRAVSNLVGFGEVSAEEVDRDEHATAAQIASAPLPALPNGAVFITGVEEKSGEKNGKPWKRALVTTSDGRSGSTFDKEIIADAKAAKATQRPVVPTFEQDGKYSNLVGLVAPPVVVPPTVDTEPIGGPEKILSIRAANIAPGQAPYWFIQSDRREYVTNLQPVVDAAEGLRTSRGSAIVEFERIATATGTARNRITEFGAAPVDANLPL